MIPNDGAARNVLVTGGAGFIGHHLVQRLLGQGHAVTVLDDLTTGQPSNLPDHPALTLVEGSVLDAEPVGRAAQGIDTVYHLASVVGMRRAVQQRDHAWDVSTTGTARVLDATGTTPVVVFSSSAVYGLTQAVRAREDADLSEDDTRAYDGGGRGYSTGKLHLERLAADASRAGRAVLVVRPFNVVGPGQSGSYGMVLPRFLAAARAGEALVIHDDGAQARAFSEVHTFLSALDRLAAQPDAWAPGRNVFNIGAPTPTRILDLARLVVEHAAAHTGRRAPLRFEPYADAFPGHTDVRVRVPDVTRLSALVGSLDWPSIDDIVRQLSEADAAEPVSVR